MITFFLLVWDLYPDFVGICPCANPALAAILFPPNRRTKSRQIAERIEIMITFAA